MTSLDSAKSRPLLAWPETAVCVLFFVLSALAMSAGRGKLVGIAWTAFLAMTVGMVWGGRVGAGMSRRGLKWAHGLCSGAMIASACGFLLPTALKYNPGFGGFGVALGLLTGYGLHVFSRTSQAGKHEESVVTALTLHTVTAGAIIGLVYSAMPALGPVLGLAIVSHKGPAGYAAASRLQRMGRRPTALLVPACGVGIAALPFGLWSETAGAVVNGVVFGFATGIFIHIAMDFLPSCEDSAAQHIERIALRLDALLSTALGAAVVFGAWLALHGYT